LGIDSKSETKPVSKVIEEAKHKRISLKRLAQAAQATANIKPKSSKAHIYWNKVGKVARAEAHKAGDEYSLKYPKAETKKIINEGMQARLKG